MSDQPKAEADVNSCGPSAPAQDQATGARRSINPWMALGAGGLVGAAFFGGLYFAAAVIYLGFIQDCWG
jgi:hypothetical protein